MNSVPISGDKLYREPAMAQFRGEEYAYVYSCYVEPDGQRYTTTALDEVNVEQVYNQYRERHGIPFPDEIERMKQMYGLSNAKLATILGFGENQIANYIDGEIPSNSNGRTLAAIRNVTAFEAFVDNAREQLGEKAFLKVKERLARMKETPSDPVSEIIYGSHGRNIFNGFAPQDTQKLRDVIMYVLSAIGDTFVSKMNKLLFYIDMVSYRERGMAITGLSYTAKQFGTIPFRSDKIYPLLDIPRKVYYDGGREFAPCSNEGEVKTVALRDTEEEIINKVCSRFRDVSCSEISELNHEEPAWKQYRDTDKPITFESAFMLIQI